MEKMIITSEIDIENIPFDKIESVVLDTKLLSGKEKWLYTALKSFRNRKSKLCFPSLERIAKKAGLTKQTVLKYRKRLKEVGLIDWPAQEGWKEKTHYRFILEDGSEAEKLRVLENLSMVKKKTNGKSVHDGQKGNQGRPACALRSIHLIVSE